MTHIISTDKGLEPCNGKIGQDSRCEKCFGMAQSSSSYCTRLVTHKAVENKPKELCPTCNCPRHLPNEYSHSWCSNSFHKSNKLDRPIEYLSESDNIKYGIKEAIQVLESYNNGEDFALITALKRLKEIDAEATESQAELFSLVYRIMDQGGLPEERFILTRKGEAKQ